MKNEPFDVPILFIVFRRPEHTRRVLEAIRKVRPTRLFITADGPRANNPEEARLCAEARAEALKVDWPCEVKTLFREKNYGIKYGPGFDWFFDQVEEGIILEDDDMPDPSFFPFCKELLEKYRDHPRIMSICGTNVEYFNKKFSCKESYYFLTPPSFWGMATWRRAWKHYDVEVRRWPEVRDSKFLYDILPGASAYAYSKKFEGYYNKTIQAYDGPWVFACFINRGLTIYPSHNLISNIGYGPGAHGAAEPDPHWHDMRLEPMHFPLIHPKKIAVNPAWEAYNFAESYNVNRFWSAKAKWWFKSHFPDQYLWFKRKYYKRFKPRQYNTYVSNYERALLP